MALRIGYAGLGVTSRVVTASIILGRTFVYFGNIPSTVLSYVRKDEKKHGQRSGNTD